MTKSRLLQVSDAAELIAKLTGESCSNLKIAIGRAWQYGKLPLYNLNGRRLSPGIGEAFDCVSWEDEGLGEFYSGEPHWHGVDDDRPHWRADIQELMDYFGYHSEKQAAILEELENPKPIFAPTKKEAPRGVPKKEILDVVWPLPPGASPMGNILTECPAWVAFARIPTGKAGGASHLWNPAQLALCLQTDVKRRKWRVANVKLLTTVINHNFSDYADEWAEILESIGASNTGN